MTDYVAYHRHLDERLMQFGKEMPGPMTGFARLHKKAVEDGALSAKTKELMALAISIVVNIRHRVYAIHHLNLAQANPSPATTSRAAKEVST